MRNQLIFPVAILVTSLWAQEQPPAAAPPGQVPSKPVLENTGAPMSVFLACGDEEIHTAGLTCTVEAPCDVYLELATVEPAGARLFVTGNLHTASSTISSVLLASDDGGKTWREPFERIPLAILDQIQFFDFETGWVAGQIVRPLPRDPFLLLTTDGGKTWRRSPLFSESRIGVIEKFWFESRTEGALWLDRTQSGEFDAQYERYETMTGGESWSLRESSAKPIPTKGGAAAQRNTGWRVRPNAPSKSYRIERRDGQAWRSVAEFSIGAGECRPKEQALPELVAEPPAPAEEKPRAPVPATAKPPKRKR